MSHVVKYVLTYISGPGMMTNPIQVSRAVEERPNLDLGARGFEDIHPSNRVFDDVLAERRYVATSPSRVVWSLTCIGRRLEQRKEWQCLRYQLVEACLKSGIPPPDPTLPGPLPRTDMRNA